MLLLIFFLVVFVAKGSPFCHDTRIEMTKTTSRRKRKSTNANSQLQNCIIAVAALLLILALVNVLLLHSHLHRSPSTLDLITQSTARKSSQTMTVTMQSMLEANNITSFSYADLQACPSLPRTACSATKYTIIVVCSDESLPRLMKKVLQWMHDPWIHQIVLLFPSSVQKTVLERDPFYGARFLHWDEQQMIQLVFVDLLVNVTPSSIISTEALVWVTQPNALVSNLMVRDAFRQWKSDSSRSIKISTSTQWFVVHRNWLCVLNVATNSTNNTWDATPFHELLSKLASDSKASLINTC